MKPTTSLPDDPALPALMAIHASGLADVMPALDLQGQPVELVLRAYKPGSYATLEARTGSRHFAVKICAQQPAEEAAVYEALATAGLAGQSGVRVPPLLAWARERRMLVIGWLDGPTAHELIKSGQGKRAGELAASWLGRAASLPVKLGAPFDAAHMLRRAGKWTAALGTADASLGTAAKALVGRLTRTQPKESTQRLVHGSFHDRNVLDLGDGPGVIDWQRFGQGSAEVEAGKFLAAVARVGLDGPLAGEAARAEEAFLRGTTGLLNERALAWHRAAALLSLADRLLTHRQGDWEARAHTLLAQAAQLGEVAGRT